MRSSFWWFLFWWGTKKPWKNRLWRWLCQSLLRGENEAIRWVRRNPGGGDCVDTKRRRGKSTSLWRYCGPSLMQIPPLDQVGKKIFPSFKFCSDRTHDPHCSPVLQTEVSTFVASDSYIVPLHFRLQLLLKTKPPQNSKLEISLQILLWKQMLWNS